MARTARLRLALAALLLLAAALPCAAHFVAPMRIEKVQAGPYTLELGFYADPVRAGREANLLITPQPRPITRITVLAEPAPGLSARLLTAPVKKDNDDPRRWDAFLTLPAPGRWSLVITLNGPRGPGSVRVPLEVEPPAAIPFWAGYALGLSPLLLWLLFGQVAWRRLRQGPPLPWTGAILAAAGGAAVTAAALAFAPPARVPQFLAPPEDAVLSGGSFEVSYVLPRDARMHHGHIRLDDGDLHMVYGKPEPFANVPPGPHTLTLVAADAQHREYGPTITRRITVTTPPAGGAMLEATPGHRASPAPSTPHDAHAHPTATR